MRTVAKRFIFTIRNPRHTNLGPRAVADVFSRNFNYPEWNLELFLTG